MGSLAAGLGNVVGQAQGLGKSAGLFQELTGQPGRVQFTRTGAGVLLQCDGVLNESHTRDSAPTQFPVESGASISDHIILGPVEVSITGVVSDTPLYDAKRFLTQSIGNGAVELVPPLGVVAAATGYALANPKDSFFKPSVQAFRTLRAMQAGDPDALPPTLPQPFNILTAYARYTNMVVKSLQFPRDAGTNGLCTFTLVATQLRIVSPQVIATTALKNPALGAGVKKAGEKETKEPDAFTTGLNSERGTSAAIKKSIDSASDTISSGYEKVSAPIQKLYKIVSGG